MARLVEGNTSRDSLRELTDQYRTLMLVIDELTRAFGLDGPS